MLSKKFLMTATACAIAMSGAAAVNAQTEAMNTRGVVTDGSVRTASETAELYASTIAYLLQTIENDITADTGTSVIEGLRAGRLDGLPSMNANTYDLIQSLNIRGVVVDTDPTPGVEDERIIVYVTDDDMRQNIKRADIEAEAKRNEFNGVMRIQNGTVIGPEGRFDLPRNMPGGVPVAAVGAYMGISGNDKITSSGAGSKEVRVIACEAGYYGTGRVYEYDISRTTNLGGDVQDVTEADASRRLISESCAPEYAQRTRYFDACTASDGSTGQALYEADQYVRQSSTNPFETDVWIDRANAVRIDEVECLAGDRISDAQDFLINGRTQAPVELSLKSSTSNSDLGNGPNRVPAVVDPANGSAQAVSGIPFTPNSTSDFQYTRSCAAEYAPISPPAGYTGPNSYTGTVSYFRDYNRRETYFSDNQAEYILNYDLVRDPNPYGHAPKGRGPIASPNGTATPGGDGWYKFTETCTRDLTHPEVQTRQVTCAARYAAYPNGSVSERRDGIGDYRQTTPDNPAANGPTLLSITWDPWYETGNSCSRTTVTRTNESRTIQTTSGNQRCDQPQQRTRVDTLTEYQTGGSNTNTSYDPDWINSGGTSNCTTISTGNSGDGGMNENAPGTSDSGQSDYGGDGGTGPGGSGNSGGEPGGGPPAR